MNFRPIFISGCDLSGTSLVTSLLGTSEWTVAPPDCAFVIDYIIQSQFNAFNTAEDVAKRLLEQPSFVDWKLSLNEKQIATLINLESERETIETLLARYISTYHHQKEHADVWVAQTPQSFSHYSTLKFLFPESRFIHMVRDGRAVSQSICGMKWGPNNTYTASRYWAENVQRGLGIERVEQGNCLRIRYEDLILTPEKSVQAICTFADIPYSPTMLSGGELKASLVTEKNNRSQSALRGEKVNRWRRTMAVRHLAAFENHKPSHQILRELGYETYHKQCPSVHLPLVIANRTHDFLVQLYNRIEARRLDIDGIRS